MRVAQSDLSYELEDVYILESGVYYFFKGFIISEVNEGILFNWEMAQDLIELAHNHYGRDAKISYISNRVNEYSMVPQDWLKFFNRNHKLKRFAIVTYTEIGIVNVMLEKMFFKSTIKRFDNLSEAVHWATDDSEIQQSQTA